MMEESSVRTAWGSVVAILLVAMASITHAQSDLDRQRDAFYQVDKALDTIGLKPGMTVGQIGADSGYLVLKLAARVDPNGRVLASGTDRALLESVKTTAARSKLAPVEPIFESAPEDTSFPTGSLDAVFLFDTWKFLTKRLRDAAPALKPGGCAILIVMEDGARSRDASGTPFSSEFLCDRQGARMNAGVARYAVDRIDDA
jgi:predicted methyltransferase